MKKIGIIGAMDEEVDILKDIMFVEEISEKIGLSFIKGQIEGKEVVIVRSGIGKVNASACCQILISEYEVDAVINTGVAGALHKDLDVLDIVLSIDTLEHDFDATGFGYKKSEIPRMQTSIFKASDKLLDAGLNAAKKLNNHKTLKGRIVTGDIFVNDSKLKKDLVENFDGYCTEMEGAAIGHTCYLNDIPFLIIRSMSDKADGSADTIYSEFVIKAAENSKNLLIEILKQL